MSCGRAFVIRIALVAVGLASWAGLAPATTLVQMDLDQMTRKSDVVLIGQVQRTHSYWNAEHELILTDVEIRPHRMLKGSRGGESVVFTVLGGVVGELAFAVTDGPEFAPGKEYAVFLSPDEDLRGRGKLTLTGFSQGAFLVTEEVPGKRRLASQARGIPLLSADGTAVSPAEGQTEMSEDEFVQRVTRAQSK